MYLRYYVTARSAHRIARLPREFAINQKKTAVNISLQKIAFSALCKKRLHPREPAAAGQVINVQQERERENGKN